MGLFDKIKSVGVSLLDELDVAPEIVARTRGEAPKPKIVFGPGAKTNTPAKTATPAPKAADNTMMYDPQLEKLMEMAIADGEVTDKERQVLLRKAESLGVDLDEFEMVLEVRLAEQQKKLQAQAPPVPAPPMPGAAKPGMPMPGMPMQAPAPSQKSGDIKKCPACGCVIPAFTTRCPDCGHEIRNVEANNSIQRLFEMLNEAENESRNEDSIAGAFLSALEGGSKVMRKKKTIVQNFPIPNTKEDILEFLALAMPLARKPKMSDADPERNAMYPVWKAKCEQIMIKARFSMKDDPETLAQINELAKENGF